MAYVRKTQTLITEVQERVKTMRENELRTVADDKIEIGTPVHASFRRACEDALWEEAPHLKAQMPDKWCTISTHAHFSMPEGLGASGRRTLVMPDTDPIKYPPSTGSYYPIQLKPEHVDDAIRSWAAEAEARATQRRLISEKYSSLSEQLTAFLDKFPSLNAALKEMPELEFYIPTHYLEKVAEPTEPRERVTKAKVQEEMNIDVDALASMAIAHRITAAR
jgi:hypothetical protein